MRPGLTKKEIEKARALRKLKWSDRKIAEHLKKPKTTIWENAFRRVKRSRVTLANTQDTRPQCMKCEIKLTRDLPLVAENHLHRYIPVNFQMGDKCLSCYLEELGFRYIDIV